MDQFNPHSVHCINAPNFPILARYIVSGDFANALRHLNSLNRDDLFDTLLYSGLGVKGAYGEWINNISHELQQACEQGYIENQAVFDKIRAHLN
ncbi:hypothetical protein DS2_07153 [Catenovulum agarivorans DS-2]|uniref:Uncharacterized protein n=1 Tax=Catenovulum agarivorans DS-2 TaxID=1328313 RepID=W7QZ13_9ALTE|nr:hypothetical protein [Catenovulum agarivorans]EWH10590.1 hypothetical protein DS2_07153 [Catenovulum agarivorans DS-2]